MMLLAIILVVLGVGMVIFAAFEIFTTGKAGTTAHKKIQEQPLPVEDPGKDQKIQRLQNQVVKLEKELENIQAEYAQGKFGFIVAQQKEAEFSVELKRREEWVAKAEAELAKIKPENLDLINKFTAKEKELQEEFTKNVNLSREIRELKSALEAKEMSCTLKEDQIQAQKHQIESLLKNIQEHLAKIAEFNRKEKISEWVPKTEFNKLNEEYSRLEKDLEASQERLKNFAEEIAHLRQDISKRTLPAEKEKPEETKATDDHPEREGEPQ
jgi:chromosome segregation ATPase